MYESGWFKPIFQLTRFIVHEIWKSKISIESLWNVPMYKLHLTLHATKNMKIPPAICVLNKWYMVKKSHSAKYHRNTIAGHLNKPCDSLAHWPIRWIAHEFTTPHICCGIYYVRITHTHMRAHTNTSSRKRQSLVTIAQYLFISNETLTIDNKPLCETPIWWWIPTIAAPQSLHNNDKQSKQKLQ